MLGQVQNTHVVDPHHHVFGFILEFLMPLKLSCTLLFETLQSRELSLGKSMRFWLINGTILQYLHDLISRAGKRIPRPFQVPPVEF